MSTTELNRDILYVGIGATIDYSRWEFFSSNKRIEELQKPKGLVYFEVNSLKEAVELVRNFISEYRLGSSNWIGGLVTDSLMNFVAKISYNGRVWDNEDWKVAKEIEVC